MVRKAKESYEEKKRKNKFMQRFFQLFLLEYFKQKKMKG